MRPVWQLLSVTTVSLLSYEGKAYHLHCTPGRAHFISVGPEIWRADAERPTVFLYHPHTENRRDKKLISS